MDSHGIGGERAQNLTRRWKVLFRMFLRNLQIYGGQTPASYNKGFGIKSAPAQMRKKTAAPH